MLERDFIGLAGDQIALTITSQTLLATDILVTLSYGLDAASAQPITVKDVQGNNKLLFAVPSNDPIWAEQDGAGAITLERSTRYWLTFRNTSATDGTITYTVRSNIRMIPPSLPIQPVLGMWPLPPLPTPTPARLRPSQTETVTPTPTATLTPIPIDQPLAGTTVALTVDQPSRRIRFLAAGRDHVEVVVGNQSDALSVMLYIVDPITGALQPYVVNANQSVVNGEPVRSLKLKERFSPIRPSDPLSQHWH